MLLQGGVGPGGRLPTPGRAAVGTGDILRVQRRTGESAQFLAARAAICLPGTVIRVRATAS